MGGSDCDKEWLRFAEIVEVMNGTVEWLGDEIQESPTSDALARFVVDRVFGVTRWKRGRRGEVLGKFPRSVLGGAWVRVQYCPVATGEVQWVPSRESRHCVILAGPEHESFQRRWLATQFQVYSVLLVEDARDRAPRGRGRAGPPMRVRLGTGQAEKWCIYRDLNAREGLLKLEPHQVEMFRRLSGPRSREGGSPPPIPI